MGLLLKLLFSDSKDQLNVVVEDYDRVTKKVLRTMLDVVVDIESTRKDVVSDIDDISNVDITSNLWDAAGNDLEGVLGEELGLEISNIIGNAKPFANASSNDKSDSALAAVVSMAEKCTLTDKDEEEILNADFSKINVSKDGTDPDAINLNESDETMIEATVLDEDTVLSLTSNYKNDKTEKTENNSSIPNNRSQNEDQSNPSASLKNEDQSTPSARSKQEPQSNNSAKSKDLSTPGTSGTSSQKDVLENSKSPKKVVTERSNSTQRSGHESDDDCEFVIEEVLDFDVWEDVDSWSVADASDGEIVVDLTDRENIDPLFVRTRSGPSTDAGSCGSDRIISLGNDYSDDDDEVCSQYSSARSGYRRRAASESLHSSKKDRIPHHKALSDHPEDLIETIYDDDDRGIQVVDLTYERDVQYVDLTNEKTCGAAPIAPIMIQRTPTEVMNDLRNYYTSNKDMIAAQKDALRAFARRADKKRSGIEAPPKLSNCLPRRKRCSPLTHETDIKFSRIARSSGLRERDENAGDESRREGASLNREVPEPTRGPPGFRLNDDLGEPDPVQPKDEDEVECASRDRRSYLCGRASRQFYFRGNRRGGRTPLARGFKFRPRMQGKRFFKRSNHNYMSPLRRQNCVSKSSRTIQPTHFRGEVWLDLK